MSGSTPGSQWKEVLLLIASSRSSVPWPLAMVVLQHHERIDGPKCPQGPATVAIRIEAHVLAAADVVEARLRIFRKKRFSFDDASLSPT